MLSLTDRDRDNPIKYANASVYCGPITSFVSACVSVYVPVNVSANRPPATMLSPARLMRAMRSFYSLAASPSDRSKEGLHRPTLINI